MDAIIDTINNSVGKSVDGLVNGSVSGAIKDLKIGNMDGSVDGPVEYTGHYTLTPGASNAAQRLPVSLLVSQIIDLATEHANMLGFGSEVMDPQQLGWVLSRLTVQMERWPRTDTSYTITTWVESWNRRFSSRCFEVCDADGRSMGFIRSVWMVIDVATHRGTTTDRLNFSERFISSRECPIPLQDKHLSLERLTDGHEQGVLTRTHYTFKYTDIDFYRHVNTVRYIELLLNQYSLEDFDRYMMNRLELAFMHESLYGQTATIHRLRREGDCPADDFVLELPEGAALRARVRLMRVE